MKKIYYFSYLTDYYRIVILEMMMKNHREYHC